MLDFLDHYELYTLEDNLLSMGVLFSCFYDRTQHSHSGEAVSSSKKYSWAISLNPKERERYSEEWVTPFLTPQEIEGRANIILKKLPPQWCMTMISRLSVLLVSIGLFCIMWFYPSARFLLLPVGVWIILDIVKRFRKNKDRQ